ncbi:hypothetical protein FKR81_40475 [Lentzea tibetensis]|uniref:Uncharacterized protein n=1 Tax=Lentzea tibetensis TaxID=2591470 RepID=A0A563EFU6_9PSEU|nr:hypothetical protein [Lentzea tibetensis]TWP44961.1 hypothetical protein FKR81_40475 [Lentzea tibetensis]
MLPAAASGNGKDNRKRQVSSVSEEVAELSLRGPKREKVETGPTLEIEPGLTLEIGPQGPTPQQYDALTGFARDVAHTALAYYAKGEVVPPVTVSAPLLPVADQVQQVLDNVITSYLPYIQHAMPGGQWLSPHRISITKTGSSGTATTVSLPLGTAMTPAPQVIPPPLPQYNIDIVSLPSPSLPSSSSNNPSSSHSSSQSTNPPMPQRYGYAAKQKLKGSGSRAEWFAPLWGVLLKHPEPMGVNDILNSGELPPGYPTSKLRNYLLAMKEAGLAVENGQASKAYLYSPVMPQGLSETESDALLDWARGLPAPAASTAATSHLNIRPNILQLPETLHTRLVQNTHKNSENSLLVSRIFEVLLTAEKPLSQQEIANLLKEHHHFPNATKATVAPYLSAMVDTFLASSSIEGAKSSNTPLYSVRILLPPELLDDGTFKKFIDNLPNVNGRARAKQRSEGVNPIAQHAATTAPANFPTADTLKSALHPDRVTKGGLTEANALRVWSVLLTNDPATNNDLETALSGTTAAKDIARYTLWLQRSNMAVVARKLGNTNAYKGVVPQGLETDSELCNWVEGLPSSMRVKAQNQLNNTSVAPPLRSEPPVPPLPSHITDLLKEEDNLSGHRTSQVLGILMRTDTPLTNEMIQMRLKSDHNVDTSKGGVNTHLLHLRTQNMASHYGKDGRRDLYVGSVPESYRRDPDLAQWAAQLTDDGERANAQARIEGTEPLGTTRPLPPLPAALRYAFGDGVGAKRAAATLGALLSTDKPLNASDVADAVQRDYHIGHGTERTDATRLDLAKMRTSGLLKELDKTRSGSCYTSVVPTDMANLSAQEREGLRKWALDTLTGRAQMDALARISGVEPLDSYSKLRGEIEPIKRSNFLSETEKARPLPRMQGGKQLFHKRHIIPSHQIRDTFKSWVNYHHPPGHDGRADMVKELQAWEKQMFNHVPNLWVGRGNTNSAAGFLSRTFSDAADYVDDTPHHVTGSEAVKAVEYNRRAHFNTQEELAEPILEYLNPSKDRSTGTSSARDDTKLYWMAPEWSASEFLNDASSSADFDWPGGTREQYEQFMDVYLQLRNVALAPNTYSLSDLTNLRNKFLNLREPSAVSAGNGLLDYEATQTADVDSADEMDVDDYHLPPPPPPMAGRLEDGIELAAQQLSHLSLDTPHTYVTSKYNADIADLEIGLDQLMSQLPTMSPMERAAALERLHGNRQNLLTGKTDLIHQLRNTLPPEVFAQTAAQLMVRWAGNVDQPVTARREAESQIARLLGNPDITERLLDKGVQVVLIPEATPLTELEEFRHLANTEISPEHGTWNTARGAGGTILVAVGAENLTGGTTTVSHAPHYDDGYSVLVHEFAHTIHEHGLSDKDRKTIDQAFRDKWEKVNNAEQVQWPDGPTYGTNLTQPNYSATTAKEYFAQLATAYLGANTGHDPYTHLPRNNSKSHIEQHESDAVAGVIQSITGDNANPITANPVQQHQAEHDFWQGYREFQTAIGNRTPTNSTATNSPALHPINNLNTNSAIANAASLRCPKSASSLNNPTHTTSATPPALATTTTRTRSSTSL